MFDEARYTSNTRPPGPQLLYSLGMPKQSETQSPNRKNTVKNNLNNNMYPTLSKSKLNHTTIAINQVAAKASKVDYLWKQEDVHTIFFPNTDMILRSM